MMFLDPEKQKDYEWFLRDEISWEQHHNSLQEVKKRNFDDFLGEEFKNPPLKYIDELMETINSRQDRLCRLNELKAPGDIIMNEQLCLEKDLLRLKSGEFIVSPLEKEYREKYDERVKLYYDRSNQRSVCLD